MIDRHRTLVPLVAALALAAIAGCTSDQAAIYGKLMLGLMVALLIAIPIVFYTTWRRRAGR